ncbi:nitrite reductase/ring-hydroxylating ferredoxin subunit [Motilibacter peucedani]|uniref:Nitrite reductase/ring-hydroxylating ferredoxin subunit n=2 Tax=Motilibacter peucedani TaxID=598650 RepID=A0A420XK47_9ACTN|nr:nitrite reductase/ring-hydroxylating ferredoxin subunit [Motilibacter peucedani]
MRLTTTIERSMEKVEDAGVLDKVSQPLLTAVRRLTGASPAVTDLLHGVPVGHPVHPAMVLLPAGAFISASTLDFVPRTGSAVPVLIATGIATSVPAAAAGFADWSELHPQQQRVGLVHAASNGLGVAFYAASLVARLRGRPVSARVLGLAGLSAIGVGGYLGGHLAYRQGAGVNHVEDVPHLVPPGWNDVCAIDDLPEGRPALQHLGDVPLLVVRRGKQIDVLSDRCSHLSGPLHEGTLSEVDGATCVTCPWHGSTFALADGKVVRGPATVKQHSFDVRVEAGRLQVRLPHAG